MEEGADAGGEKARLRVKLGAAEIDFEGGAGSLEKSVLPMIDKMFEMVRSHADLQRPSPAPLQIEAKAMAAHEAQPESAAGKASFDHSTHTIAVAMKTESAGDLAMAACAHLCLIQKKERFTRKEILEEMKTAPSFYSSNMRNNLSNTLAKLTGSTPPRLRLVGPDTYALANSEKTKLERIVAEIE